jgi:phosphoserine phosphatase RsbU/P
MESSQPRHRSFLEAIGDFMRTIFSGEFWTSLRHDLRDVYQFYVDDDTRQRLGKMRPIRRFIRASWIVLKALYAKLTPVRQVLLIIAIALFFFPQSRWEDHGSSLNITWSPFGFLMLLFILILELKDKLLAKDELRAGHSVQEALMPRDMPVFPGWDIWLFTTPANDVGGDLVDYLRTEETALDLTLADIAGKGLGAALMAAKLQATLRAIAPESDSLVQIADRVNAIICRDGLPNRFATLAYVRLRGASSNVKILNAGHLPPIILRSSGIEQLNQKAPAIGLTPQAVFGEQEVQIGSSEYLVMVSDGVLEARNDREGFFGEERFQKLLLEARGGSAESIGRRILKEVELFVGDAPRSDDISLVILRKL